jgi:hypothetical protein
MVDGNGEKVKQVRDGPGVVKSICEGLDRGTEGRRMDHGRLAHGHVNKQVYVQGW